MHSAASYEARSCEELRRIPFQWLKQKSILARALKRVKEPRHEVAGQLPITASGVRPLSGVLIRENGLDCLLAAVSVSVPVLLLGGQCRFGGRDGRAAPATRWPNWWFIGKWDCR